MVNSNKAMPNSTAPILDALKALLVLFPNKRWVVAYSGGVDSTVLLHGSQAVSSSVRALHINHGLHGESDDWANHCVQVADTFGVSCQVFQAEPYQDDNQPSIEAWARTQRYRIFSEQLQADEILLMAHHQQDQAETLLLNLMRGSGVSGLAGMPSHRTLGQGQLYRPLLSVSKQVIDEYAKHHQLLWVEDPSNQQIDFDRNYIRHEILPKLTTRWPHAVQAIQQSTLHCQEAERLLDAYTQSLMPNFPIYEDSALALGDLVTLEQPEQDLILRAWFFELTKIRLPRQALDQLHQNVIKAAEDADPILHIAEYAIRRYQDKLNVLDATEWQAEPYCITWDGKQSIQVPGWPHVIHVQDLEQLGVNIASLDWSRTTLRSRVGGERCKPQGRVHSQTLKRLYQEAKIPPWQRDCIPLLYEDETLKAVISLWSC